MEVLCDGCEDLIVLVMDFMHFVEEGEGVKHPMSPIEEEVLCVVYDEEMKE